MFKLFQTVHLKINLTLLVFASSITYQPKTLAEIIINGWCRQGECSQIKFLSKTSLRSNQFFTLYSIKTAHRILRWEDRKKETSPKFSSPNISYVFCSTEKPAYIKSKTEGENEYTADLLNPGTDASGYNYESYQLYWTTCHNIVGPNFFSEEMTAKAISLGYPLNLISDQIRLQNPLEIMNQ